MLSAGTLVDNRFELLSPLGQGGFGEVYVARQVQLDRKVALKLLKADMADDDAIARFEREAKILAELQHPNIAMFVAFGKWRDYRYTALEFADGNSLYRYLQTHKMLSSSATLKLAQRLLEALEHAHRHGVIHRDIKPGNVIVSDDFISVKLIDFGLAHIFAKQQITQEGLAVGSVQYMSPEQCLGQPVDERSDLYSVGCILYECLTGQPAFVADDAVAVMFLQMNESRKLFAKGNEAIAMFVNRLLEKDPASRFQSATEALAQLARVQVNDRVQPVGKHATATVARKSKLPVAWVAAGVVISGIVGGGIYFNMNQPKPISKFDFGKRMQEAEAWLTPSARRGMATEKLKAIDEAIPLVAQADATTAPVLKNQVDSELRDIWWTTRESPGLHRQFVAALKREMLLPWRDDDFRYEAAHYVAAISATEPGFEQCAYEAERIMQERNDPRDCDDRMALFMILARLKVDQGDYRQAHENIARMLAVFEKFRNDHTGSRDIERNYINETAKALDGKPELAADRETLLNLYKTIPPRETL